MRTQGDTSLERFLVKTAWREHIQQTKLPRARFVSHCNLRRGSLEKQTGHCCTKEIMPVRSVRDWAHDEGEDTLRDALLSGTWMGH